MSIGSKYSSLTIDELTNISRRENFRRSKVLVFITSFVFVGILIASTYIYFTQHSSWFFRAWGPLAGLICCWWGFFFWYWPKSGSFAKFNKRALLPTSYSISSKEFSATCEDGYSLIVPISGFYEIVDGRDYFAFWENPSSAYLIPFRMLTKDEQFVISELIKPQN